MKMKANAQPIAKSQTNGFSHPDDALTMSCPEQLRAEAWLSRYPRPRRARSHKARSLPTQSWDAGACDRSSASPLPQRARAFSQAESLPAACQPFRENRCGLYPASTRKQAMMTAQTLRFVVRYFAFETSQSLALHDATTAALSRNDENHRACCSSVRCIGPAKLEVRPRRCQAPF